MAAHSSVRKVHLAPSNHHALSPGRRIRRPRSERSTRKLAEEKRVALGRR